MSIPVQKTRELFAATIAEIDQLERNLLNASVVTPQRLKELGITHRQLIANRNAWRAQLESQLTILDTTRPFRKEVTV